MRISLNWLNDYVDIKNIPAESIAETLTDLGLEVEAIEKVEPLKGEVVVGEVLEATQHPDADKLRVCRVQTGATEPLEIVCGAPNARAGIKVCVATVGSILPGDFKIKKSKIRGVASFGMLCAADELGLGSGHDGIIELQATAEIGTPVADLFNLNDTVLELGITPNRADCFGYLGVARDLAAKLGIPLKVPSLDQLRLEPGLHSAEQVEIHSESATDCPRLTALYVDGLGSVTSPLHVRRRLEASGLRPISAIVDATNYVMLEYGQPIHAYDYRDLKGKTIRVRRAVNGETLRTLDEVEHQLTPSDLLICDGEGPVGLAGIMGGLDSEVKSDTSAIVVEVASFDPRLIRKSAKRLGMHTEASHRFERGTDMAACEQVAYRVAGLLQEWSQPAAVPSTPRVAESVTDHYPSPWKPVPIALRTSRCRKILGAATLTPQEIATALEALQFPMVDKTEDGERQLFQVPSWRRDVVREIDLIEEVGRVYGYEKLPYLLPQMEIGSLAENPFIEFVDQVKLSCAEAGLNEIISLPFVGQADLDHCRLPAEHPFAQPVQLANPLAENEGLMQPTLAINLIKAIVRNRRRGVRGARLFEAGRGYLLPLAMPAASGEYLDHLTELGGHLAAKAKDETRAIEHNYLGMILDQPWKETSWQGKEQPTTFFHGKALTEQCLRGFGLKNLAFRPTGDTLIPYLHPSVAALVYADDLVIGYVGEIHPEVAQAYDLDPHQLPILIELNLERWFAAQQQPRSFASEIGRFPPVTLDLALVVDTAVTNAAIETAMKEFNRRKNLTSCRLFDVYEGDNIPTGKKSLAYALQFQSPKKTLNDNEVQKELQALQDWLKQEVGAELR